MEFDVVIVGGGPAGLAAACRLRQLANEKGMELSVCLVEKGAEFGAHILSGAVIETSALDELFPDWQQQSCPLVQPVTQDDVLLLTGSKASVKIPSFLVPSALHNGNNYVASLGNLCRWLAEQAERLGVELFPGFPASEILYDQSGTVCGIATGEMGRDKTGNEKPGFDPGYELRARYTLFAEGCRGHLGKQLIERFELDASSDPQHYALGIKELWEIPEDKHIPGKVVHTLGWPLGLGRTTGGGFLYHAENRQVLVGLVTDLSYRNPWLSPFDEFQKLKLHPAVRDVLEGGTRISWGARALVKGGLQSLPCPAFPGGLLIGDDAGLLNGLKLKGTHTAMKSGMLAARAVIEALSQEEHAGQTAVLESYTHLLESSTVGQELHKARNTIPALHKLGTLAGAAFTFIDQAVFRGRLPFTLHDRNPDHTALDSASTSKKIAYPKPDNHLTFDRLSSVFLSNTMHEEDQPCHLLLTDPGIPVRKNLPEYAEPAQRYCPAGVYEISQEGNESRFIINAANCVHCKTCDIKDPAQNITWVSPEGGGGPGYPNM